MIDGILRDHWPLATRLMRCVKSEPGQNATCPLSLCFVKRPIQAETSSDWAGGVPKLQQAFTMPKQKWGFGSKCMQKICKTNRINIEYYNIQYESIIIQWFWKSRKACRVLGSLEPDIQCIPKQTSNMETPPNTGFRWRLMFLMDTGILGVPSGGPIEYPS